MGSNMAENHPVGFQWPMEARRRGAKLIHVDPRFTRTSAMCNLFVPIRAGADIAFLGGVVNYILENERWFDEYVKRYTNAPVIIREDFADTEDLDGFFSGGSREGAVHPRPGNTPAWRSRVPARAKQGRRSASRRATAARAPGFSTASRLRRTRPSSIRAASFSS